ncbi:MAG: hypothetical protein CR972_02480 [Candidatus Moraniibacteriota bacterium]|nr:MAG: hypothetical protein CR972_02480 [Candidatus Moranbacteria bacterium]
MQMKKIIAGTSAIALSLSMTSFALAATDSETINLEVTVQDTLSMDCFDIADNDGTVTLGGAAGAGIVSAGSPAIGQSRCSVTTNDQNGYYLTIVNSTTDEAGTTDVLQHQLPDTSWVSIDDDVAGALQPYEYDLVGGNVWGATAQNWASTITGLGFTVTAVPDTTNASAADDLWADGGLSTCTTAATDSGKFFAVPDTAQTITAVPVYLSGTTHTDVCYKVDVPTTQQSGDYAGQVTYTATTSAAAYHN